MEKTKSAEPKKWIFDNDGGIDDTCALVLLLSQPASSLNLVAITAVGGNVSVDHAVQASARTLEICKKKVPIYRGAEEGLLEKSHTIYEVHGADGQGSAEEYKSLKGYQDCIQKGKHAAQAIVEIINSYPPKTISIIATGPLTNVALALKLDPSIAQKLDRLVSMGGTHYCKGNASYGAEFNYFCDPEAAHLCLREFPSMEILTCENGYEFELTQAELDQYWTSATEKGKFIKAINRHQLHKYGRIFVFDAIAATIAIDPKVIQTSVTAQCEVELVGKHSRGALFIDWHAKHNKPSEKRGTLVLQDALLLAIKPKITLYFIGGH